MEAALHMPQRHAPNEFLRLEVVAFADTIGDQVQGTEREDVQIVAANLDVVHPRLRRKANQQLARLKPPAALGS